MGTNGDGRSEDEVTGAQTGDDDTALSEESLPEQEPQDEEEPARTGLPPKMEAWRKRSATGAMLTGIALGFQQVFEPERTDAAIIQETSGDPPKDLPVEAEIEQLRPRQSVVSIRPWLLPGDKDGGTEEPEKGNGAENRPGAESNP